MDARRWEAVRAAFDDVVGLDAAERRARLAAIRAADPALHSAVESLLGADAEGDARLAVLDAPLLDDREAAARDPLGLAGRTVSHFRVGDPLGAGGMGVVYRAEDTRLGREVALKLPLPAQRPDASATRRFQREARAAAALDHPNLCTIHEVGECDDGRPFIAMALYAGETLRARLARCGALPLDEALAVGRQIAQGLACAHAAGVVHRDLKPGNVMVLPDGTAKVLDFGLARSRDATVTAPGDLRGTAAYMAPEQIRGEPADARADLWALGVVVYEMLTGRRPFGGDHEISVAHAIVHAEPARPSALRSAIPGAVDAIVLRLLEKAPARRHPSAEEVLRDLDAVRDGAPPPTAVRRAWRRRAAVASMIGLGAVATLGVPRLRGVATDRDARRAIAVLPFVDRSAAGENAYLADALHDEILASLGKVAGLHVIGRQSVLAYARTEKPLRQIAEELGVGTVLNAGVQRLGDRLKVHASLVDARSGEQLWADGYERDLTDLFAVQSEISGAIVAALRVRLTAGERERLARRPTRSPEAYDFYMRARDYYRRSWGKDDQLAAEGLYRRALALDPEFALARAGLAVTHAWLFALGHDPSTARREQLRLEAEESVRLQPDLPEAHFAKGAYWLWAARDAGRALAEFEIARAAMPNDGEAQAAVAGTLVELGRRAEGLAGFRRAAALDPLNPNWPQFVAYNAWNLRRFDEAVRAWDRVIELAPDRYHAVLQRGWVFVQWRGAVDSLAAAVRRVPDAWDDGGSRTLARVHLALYRRRPAEVRAAIDGMRAGAIDSRDYAQRAYVVQLRGDSYAMEGDTARARVEYEASRVELERGRAERPDGPHIIAQLGIIHAALGRREDALRNARHAIALARPERRDFDAALWLDHAAEAYMRLGESDTAVALLERALQTPGRPSIHYLRVEPRWDPLRNHPGFRRLVAPPAR